MEILLLVACFVFVLTAVLAGGYWFLREPEQAPEAAIPVLIGSDDEQEGTLRATLEKIGSVHPDAGVSHPKLRKKLAAAGYRDADSPVAFFGAKALTSLTVALLFLAIAIFLSAPLFSCLLFAASGAGLGYILPDRALGWKTERRRERLRAALPSAIDLLVLSLEAGQGLDGALLDASRELKRIYPELSEEFQFTCLEMRAGQSRAEVLNNFANRSGEPEIRKLCTLLLDGDRFGTSLGPALKNHARYLRTRRRQSAQEQARKTSVKLVFPVFFLIFPSVLVVTLGPAVLRLAVGMRQLMNSVP
jgi:tight adherence protein C